MLNVNRTQSKKISQHETLIKIFYNERYKRIGNNLASIGWSSKKNQIARFEFLTKNINLNKKKILDFGCGFGDLYLFLKKNFRNFKYSGYDINRSFIINNKKKFPKTNFFSEFKLIKKFDFIICSGVFSLRTKYTKFYFIKLINFLYKKSREGLMINFLSKKTKVKLKKNYYYSTREIISIVQKLKKCKINIYENYSLDEFTLHLLKK